MRVRRRGVLDRVIRQEHQLGNLLWRVPHRDWNPRRHTVRLAAGVGLWDSTNNRYLLPQVAADSSHPGGAGASTGAMSRPAVSLTGFAPFGSPQRSESLASSRYLVAGVSCGAPANEFHAT